MGARRVRRPDLVGRATAKELRLGRRTTPPAGWTRACRPWDGSTELDDGNGAMDVTIETSTDGTVWTALANVPQFAQATA